MTTESLQPTQGFLDTSTAGFLPVSSDSFLPVVSSPSLLESKQQQVAAISDAKKQSLDPSVVSAKDLFTIDADTVINKTNGEKIRFTPNIPGTSYNPFEVLHPGKPLDQPRINKNIDALVKDNPSLSASYFSNESVFARGRAGEEALKQKFKELGNVSFIPTGEKDKWGRTLADVIDPTTGQSLLSAMNNPEINADYHSKHNIVKEGQDLIQKAAEREKATGLSVSDANRETLLGGATNLVATGATAFSDSVGRVLKAPALIAQSLRETGITQKQRDLFTSLNTKMAEAEKAGVDYAPTPEEQTILESPLQAFKRETLKPVMDGERNIAASDFLNLASVAQPSMSIFQKLSASDRVQQNYIDPLNVVRDTAAGLVNTAGTDELRRQTEGLANDAVIPSITEGYKKFKGGKEVDGALQIADAVANYVVGTGRIAANNKQAAIEEIGRILPDMLMAGVSMPALFAGLGTETEAEAVKGYVKEHGVHPEGWDLARLRLDTWSSAALDSVADKYLGSSAGATKAVAGKGAAEALTAGIGGINSVAAESLASSIGGRALSATPGFIKVAGNEGGTEIVQSLLEQDAAKQDLSKIDLGEALSAGSLGAIGGAGINVASHPLDAIKEAGSAVATTGKVAIDLASKLVSDSVSQAFTSGTQAVTDAVGSTTQAVTDAAGEVGSSTTTDTPEGRKAFVAEATSRNDELFKELTAIGTKDKPTNAEGARFTELLTQIRKNKETIDGIKAKDAPDDTTEADIAIATTGLVDHPDTLQAVDRTIRSMRQSKEVSPEQLIAFEAFKTKAPLSPEQKSVAEAFIETQTALATVKKTASVVSNEVIYGQKAEKGKKGFLGMVEHQAIIADALDQDNIPAAKSALDSFKAFAANQVKKVDSLNSIVSAISDSNVEEVRGLVTQFAKDFPTAQMLKLGNTEILKLLDKPENLEVAKTSKVFESFKGLANSVGNEATMLTNAVAESELHIKLGTTEAKAVPVVQESGLLVPVGNTATVSDDDLGDLGLVAAPEGTTDYMVSVDYGDTSAKIKHLEGGGISLFDAGGVTEYDSDFVVGKTDQDILAHHYRHFEYAGSKLVSKPTSNTGLLTEDEINQLDTNNAKPTSPVATGSTQASGVGQGSDTSIDTGLTQTSTNKNSETTVETAYPDNTLSREKIDSIKDQLGQAFGELTSVLGGKMNMSPEEETKLLPILMKIFRLSAQLGYVKFRDVAGHTMSEYRKAAGDELANKLTIDHLQSGYMSVAREIGGNKAEALDYDSAGQLEKDYSKSVPVPTIVSKPAVVVKSATTTDSKLPSVSSLQSESDKRIGKAYRIYEAIIKKDNDPYYTIAKRMESLEKWLDKEVSSRIAALQISAESKQDLQSRYDDIKTEGEEVIESIKPIIEEVRAIEKEIAKQQTDVFESSNATATEVVDTAHTNIPTTPERIADIQQSFHKVLSALPEQYHAIVGAAIDKIHSLIGNMPTGLSVVQQEPTGTELATHFVHSDGSHVAALSPRLLNLPMGDDIGSVHLIDALLAHEFGHGLDQDLVFNDSVNYYSDTAEEFSDTGVMVEELKALADKTLEEKLKIIPRRSALERILNHLKAERKEGESAPHERFADAVALYINYPDFFNEHFKQTDSLLRTLISTRAAEAGVRSNDTTGTGDPKQSTKRTVSDKLKDTGQGSGDALGKSGQRTVLDPVVDRIRELVKAKNLTNLKPHLLKVINYILSTNSAKDYNPEQNKNTIAVLEDLSDKDTRSLGLQLLDSARKFLTEMKLSDFYSAKVLDKNSKNSVLLTTTNFFSTLKEFGVEDALGLPAEQLNGLHKLTEFVNKFADTFKKSTFTDARLAFDITALLKNPALYFMKEEGRDPFDENFVSTLGTIGYSWVANNANSLIEHSAEGINSLLGRDSKSKVTDQEYKILGDKQILKSALITSLGKEVVSSLGIKFNTNADGSIESKMIEALGIYVVNTLEHMDVLTKSEAIHKDIHLALKKGEAVSQEVLDRWEGKVISGENAIYFTGVATEVTRSANNKYDVTELAENIQTIVDDNRLSKGLLTELFGYAQQRALPLLEAPTLKAMPEIIKRGIKRIPERMRKALHKYASNGFTINMDNHAVYSFLVPEQRLQMLGYNETLEGVHAVNIKSVQGTNRTSRNEIEAYDQLIEHLDQQEGKLSTPMFFLSSVWKSGRAGMEGLINPQASKFHRHMLGMAAWESTIDSPAKLDLFKIAVAEALGSKVDRQSNETSLEAFDRLRNQPEIRDGVASIKYLNSGVEFSAEDKLAAQEDILAAIEKGGSKTHTLEALTALATYSETKPFTTRMTKEVDGVTNGIIIGLIQLMGHRPKELLEFLKAGGLSNDPNFVYGEFISKVGSIDNYQRIATTLVEYMGDFRKEVGTLLEDKRLSSILTQEFTKKGGNLYTLNGIEFFVGDLGTADALTKDARDIAKNPVLITSYGAAMKNVIEGLGKGIIENFYSKLEDASDNQEALDVIAKQLNNILKTKYEITTDNALTFKLSNSETDRFQKLVANSIGAGMSHAITEHFQPFIDKRKELNNAMNLVHAAFMIKYDAAYAEARKLKGSNLSREEVNALVKTLEPSMASFDHALSDGEMDTELFVASNESKTNLTDDYRVQVISKSPLKHDVTVVKNGETVIQKAGSVTARGSVSYFGFPGVGSVIKAIHSSDGAVQYKLMETSAVLNVHDADLAGIDGTMAMTQRQNLAFKEVMEDYSARAAIQKSLLRAMKALTPDEVKQVNALLQITNDKAEGFLGHDFVKSEGEGRDKSTVAKYRSIDQFVSEFTDTTKIDLAAKKELLAGLKSWGQYNLNHGAYVTEEESEALLVAIEEMEGSLEREDAAINAMVKEELAHIKKAERNRINGQIKSSATEDIDTATFVADMSATVSAQTVESIFDQLGKLDKVTDSVGHTEHLRDILSTTIKQVLNPMEILVRKLGQADSGVLAKGKIYLSMGNTSRLHTTDQSAQEVYAHELVHAVTQTALSKDYWLHKRARSLYEKVQDQITPESFLDYDKQGNVIVPAGSTLDQTIAKAKAVHDHIFDNNDITKVKYKNPITNEIEERQYSNGLLEFVAMGTTNAKFIKILAGINTNRSKRDPLTFADRVYNLFVGAINSVTSLINKTKDPAANVALMVLMHKLANANQVKSNIIMRKLEENGHLEEIVNSKLYKVLAYSALKSGELLKARKNKTLSAVGEMIGLSQDTSFEAYKKVAGKLARRNGITHKSFMAQLVTEAEGITAISALYMHMLSKSNKFIDQLRRLEAQSLTNQILGSFIAGTPSKSEGIGITKVLLKTDMGSLIDNGYTWDKMFGLLKSRSKRLAEIATVEQQLQAESPTNFDYYKTQAASLGYIMVNGQPLKWGTKINAVNIAHLGGTGKTVEGNLEAIEKYVDILASLHAIKYSDKGHVTDFVTLAEREFAKDKDNNGVMLSYLAHKDLKARALEQSFEGQKGLMIKGYTKEIYSPRVSIITAPSSMEAELKAKGYIKEREDMSKDPLDFNIVPMSMYVNKDGDTATFNKMIVSLTSNRRKGTDLAAGYSSIGELNPALLGYFDTAHATTEGQKIFASKDYADLSKITTNNLLVPVENAQHEVVGYRYLMNEATKDELLQKDNSFAKVLGAMEGSIVDKRESKKINNEVVNLMREDFLANYEKDPDLFIKFSPHSQDADDRELYAMLPADMRKEIKKVWKSDVMYVRANMFRTIFGFRKFTITEGSKEQDEMNAMHDGVLTKFRIGLRDKLRTPTAKRIEIGLQEIAKEVKDAIVIKLGGTLYNNIISNNLLLWVKGVSRSAIIKDQAMFLDAARQYQKDLTVLKELERSVRINPKLQNSANVKSKINSLKDHMAVNPMAFLMDSAVSQTIIEDVDTDESQYTYKGMVQERLSKLTSGVPAPLKKLASVAYMTHDTKLYKFMREATQLSDLVARATLHKHNTTKKGMGLVDSINDIKDTFIDYDAPTSKQIQYLNDTNFLMFTKFFIRSQKIIYQTYANAPARALSLLGFEEVFGEASTINDSNIINTSLLGKINNPLTLIDDLLVPHTVSLLDPTGAGGGSYTPQ